MAINCIVVDDEEIAINHILSYIVKVPFLINEGAFTDPSEALAYLKKNQVDLVFLDIEMPNYAIDGIDFVKIMGDKQSCIFTTAYPQYALPSYDYGVIDFLYKPFSFERFLKAVHKASAIIEKANEEPESEEFTFIRVEGKLQRIDFTGILWIESLRNYVAIHTIAERIILHITISELETMLPAKLFLRVHRSYIVAKKKIDLVEKESLSIKQDATYKYIPIGEQYRKVLLKAMFPGKRTRPPGFEE